MSQDELCLRLSQQSLVADFGLFALQPGPMQRLLDEASRIAADGLGTKFAKVLRRRAATSDFLVEAGVGWHAGVVGTSTLGDELNSPAGYAVHTGQPVLSNQLAHEQRFRVPALLSEHGIQSAINVMIGGRGEPFGVLEVDSTRRHGFMQADTAFLQGIANALSAGIARLASETAQDALLREKDLLMREVHHRVKNSLQLVRTMLVLQSRDASEETREQLDAAAGRIMSIAAVHQRLYEGGSVAESDASTYLAGLLDDMHGIVAQESGRTIALQCPPVTLSADMLTPLGLIVSELVTNALKYGAGRVKVGVERDLNGLRITVEDEGDGFPPELERQAGLGMRLVKALAKGPAGRAVHIDRSAPHGRVVVNMKVS